MAYIGEPPSTANADKARQTFYGFKVDVATGNLSVDKIDDDTMTIKLPDTDYIRDINDYRDFYWSQIDTIFQWGQQGHLEVKYV
jgi:hypothetical protein